MEQLNRVELRGVLGVIRLQAVGESRYAMMTVATDYAYKDTEGCAVIETTWHLVTAWEGKACADLSSLRKGDRIYVTGRLRNRRYVDAAGMERQQVDIVAQHVEKIEG